MAWNEMDALDRHALDLDLLNTYKSFLKRWHMQKRMRQCQNRNENEKKIYRKIEGWAYDLGENPI